MEVRYQGVQIHPSQLVPGCIITKDVFGKTNRPLIYKNTVIKAIHKQVLDRFLITEVEVAPKMASGEVFQPEPLEESKQVHPSFDESSLPVPFKKHYLHAVQIYKGWFAEWQAGASLDIGAIRDLFVPLLKQLDNQSRKDILLLPHYSSKQDYFYHHAVSTAFIAAFLGERLGMNQGEWLQLGLAGLLSDAGMAKLNESTLMKDTELTKEEYQDIKKHPIYSYRMVENISALSKAAKLGVLQHHERLDGSGYPLGTHKKKTHLFARIIAVSDMYHAMTTDRLYRSKQSPFLVMELMIKEQFGRLDHTVVQAFVKSMTNYATGTKVKISDGQKGEIVFTEASQPTRPIIRLDSGEIINLTETQNLYIREILT
ncbi:HD-GYP domain-containing protein [Thalassobacillus devorans]|uniref:HD-GYP domain-containing protein n=1 Tax=Thalassobacillus devorans TaxID=279813 RepID=UPI001ABB956F|nr:HD-GYP domain-containing protein [Thalassobacillus devorans]